MNIFKKRKFEKAIKEYQEEIKRRYIESKQKIVSLKKNIDYYWFKWDKLTRKISNLKVHEKEILISDQRDQGTWMDLYLLSRDIDELEADRQFLEEDIYYMERDLAALKDSYMFLLEIL